MKTKYGVMLGRLQVKMLYIHELYAATDKQNSNGPPAEKKPCIGEIGKPASHTFSGTLNNCIPLVFLMIKLTGAVLIFVC